MFVIIQVMFEAGEINIHYNITCIISISVYTHITWDSILLRTSGLLFPAAREHHRTWEESRILLGGGLRMPSASGRPSGVIIIIIITIIINMYILTIGSVGSCLRKATSQGTARQKSQAYTSQETAPTVFEIPLTRSQEWTSKGIG